MKYILALLGLALECAPFYVRNFENAWRLSLAGWLLVIVAILLFTKDSNDRKKVDAVKGV